MKENATAKHEPLSQAIERLLREELAKSKAITSPECLKHSILKSRMVAYFKGKIIAANPATDKDLAEFQADHYFDVAVDRIYTLSRA